MNEDEPVALTPEEIEHQEFSTTLRGYDRTEVRSFLDRVARSLREVASENETLAAADDPDAIARIVEVDVEARSILTDDDRFSALGERIAGLLRTAHDSAADMRAGAHSESERVLSEAHAEAEHIRAEAADTMARARAEAEASLESVRVDVEHARAEAQTEIDQVRADADARAEHVRTESEAEAERRRVEAEQHAEQVRAAADAEAEQVRAEAAADADRIRAAAEQESTRARTEASDQARRLRAEAVEAAEAERLEVVRLAEQEQQQAQSDVAALLADAEQVKADAEQARVDAEASRAEVDALRAARQAEIDAEVEAAEADRQAALAELDDARSQVAALLEEARAQSNFIRHEADEIIRVKVRQSMDQAEQRLSILRTTEQSSKERIGAAQRELESAMRRLQVEPVPELGDDTPDVVLAEAEQRLIDRTADGRSIQDEMPVLDVESSESVAPTPLEPDQDLVEAEDALARLVRQAMEQAADSASGE